MTARGTFHSPQNYSWKQFHSSVINRNIDEELLTPYHKAHGTHSDSAWWLCRLSKNPKGVLCRPVGKEETWLIDVSCDLLSFFFNWKAHRPQTMVFASAWYHQRVWRPFCSSSQRSWSPFTLHPGISLDGGEVQTAAVLQISQQIVFLKWMQWDYFRCGYNYFSGQILQWDPKRPLIAGHRQIFCMEGNQLSNLALQTVFNHVAVRSPARSLALSLWFSTGFLDWIKKSQLKRIANCEMLRKHEAMRSAGKLRVVRERNKSLLFRA